MISKTTTLVLGAGASQPFGFPTGFELFMQVCSPSMVHRLHTLAGYKRESVESFLESLSRSGQQSVDAFLEHRPEFANIGKMAIAHVLVPCEKPEALFVRRPDHLYDHIAQALNCPPGQFAQNRLSVVTFNYDRSFEFYLPRVLQHKYGLPLDEAQSMASSVPIVHVHGQLGSGAQRAYAPVGENVAILGIKVMHEDVSTTPEFDAARRLLHEAERVVFLGFGYAEKNLERLQVESRRSGHQTFGSAFGLTELERSYISERFGSAIKLGARDHSCFDFLRHNVRLADA